MTRGTAALAIGLLLSGLATRAIAESTPRLLAGTRAAAATLIVQGIEGGVIPFAALALPEGAEALPSEDGEDRFRLPIVFELSASSLTAAASGLELYAYALTKTGGVAGHVGIAVPQNSSGDRSGLRLQAWLEIPAGSYSLRFLALDPTDHRSGLRRSPIEVGASSTRPVGAPRFEDTCQDWQFAPRAAAPTLTTAALPVLVRGERITSSVQVLGSETASDLRARLLPKSAESKESHLLPVELVRTQSGSTDRATAELEFDLTTVARGVYDLSFEFATGEGTTRSPVTEVWIVDRTDLLATTDNSCDRTWRAVVARSDADQPTQAPAERAAPAENEVGRRALRQGYRQLLGELASHGDLTLAAEQLCRLEKQFVAELTGLQALLRLEVEIVRKLGAREAEVLPPLMLLHHEAYLEHRRQKQFPLVGHSARAVRAISELVLAHDDRPESRRLASQILTSLAEHGHRNRSFIPSQLLLDHALVVEPENPAALRLLAVSYEWFGRYAEAANLLERLVALRADDREARLRLAIQSRRIGAVDEAEEHFRRVLAEGGEGWVLSLAYQGLGALLIDQERFDEAVATLEQGRARRPGDQRLHLMAAHSLERTGRVAEAIQLLESLPVDGSLGSPRYRYGESRSTPLATMRDDIRRAAAVRLPLLARAVGVEGQGVLH